MYTSHVCWSAKHQHVSSTVMPPLTQADEKVAVLQMRWFGRTTISPSPRDSCRVWCLAMLRAIQLLLCHKTSVLAHSTQESPCCVCLQAPMLVDDSTYLAPGSFQAALEVSSRNEVQESEDQQMLGRTQTFMQCVV